MKDKRSSDDVVLSDAQMREVIERATRELPRPSGVTVEELRQIAAELDIDPGSLERALDEVIGFPVAGQPIRSWFRRQLTKLGHLVDPFLPNKGRLVFGALFGGIAGWLNAFLMTFSIQSHYPVALVMLGMTFANLLSRRRDRQFPRFVAETVATWGVYAVSWAVTYGGVTGNLVLWVLLWTCVATFLGWLLMRAPSGDGNHPSLLAPDSKEVSREPFDDARRTLRARISLPGPLRAGALRHSGA